MSQRNYADIMGWIVVEGGDVPTWDTVRIPRGPMGVDEANAHYEKCLAGNGSARGPMSKPKADAILEKCVKVGGCPRGRMPKAKAKAHAKLGRMKMPKKKFCALLKKGKRLAKTKPCRCGGTDHHATSSFKCPYFGIKAQGSRVRPSDFRAWDLAKKGKKWKPKVLRRELSRAERALKKK